jgi:predicted transcriptional regulator
MGQTLINITIAAVSYYIGTTQQSAKKDETIASINKGTT